MEPVPKRTKIELPLDTQPPGTRIRYFPECLSLCPEGEENGEELCTWAKCSLNNTVVELHTTEGKAYSFGFCDELSWFNHTFFSLCALSEHVVLLLQWESAYLLSPFITRVLGAQYQVKHLHLVLPANYRHGFWESLVENLGSVKSCGNTSLTIHVSFVGRPYFLQEDMSTVVRHLVDHSNLCIRFTTDSPYVRFVNDNQPGNYDQGLMQETTKQFLSLQLTAQDWIKRLLPPPTNQVLKQLFALTASLQLPRCIWQ
jgi:hypothetical protein